MIILLNETCNLELSEPYKDLPASSFPPLNLIFSFFSTLPSVVVGALSSILSLSNVKKSENGEVLKFLLSFSTITLSNAKLVFVN